MKTIGLLGGMSWESTVPYYQTINRAVSMRLGALHSAQLLLYSVNFHQIMELQHQGRWEECGDILADAAARLEKAGADVLVICTNTMHRVAPQIESVLQIPLLHIADATANEARDAGVNSLGLLATRFTMEQEFYRGRLEEHGLNIHLPPKDARQRIHQIIYEELCRGIFLEESRTEFRRFVSSLVSDGCEGIILGCTEIGLLLSDEDSSVPLFDTAEIHAERAAAFALEE